MPTPFVNLKKVKRVMVLKLDGLRFSDIARKMGHDRKTIVRWYDFGIGNKKYIHRTRNNTRGKLSTR